jgi:mannose-1-phosphate guanylyltransferase
MPKPVVPLVDQPFLGYMLEWLRRHGVTDVLLSCGFLADGVKAVLGEGDRYGVRLRYVEEPEPLGTGGALKYAEELLEERFFMLNGDILTDIDLTAQLAQHQSTGARATLALVPVADPSAYGLVPLNEDGSVREFLEKPGPDEVIDADLVNAGAYILERDVLDGMAPAGTNISIERDLFPTLVGHGLYGCPSTRYWLDIGTPSRYLQATFDILEGNVETGIGARLSASGMRLLDDVQAEGRVVGPAVIGNDCVVGPGAIVGGRVVLGNDVRIDEGARVESSVLLDGVSIGAGCAISDAIIGPEVTVGARCRIGDGVVLGRAVRIGSDNTLAAGVGIFPDVHLPDGAIRF